LFDVTRERKKEREGDGRTSRDNPQRSSKTVDDARVTMRYRYTTEIRREK